MKNLIWEMSNELKGIRQIESTSCEIIYTIAWQNMLLTSSMKKKITYSQWKSLESFYSKPTYF